MSFLTKSKISLADSPARFGSKLDNKDRFTIDTFNNKPKEDIMSGLQVFREGLRKEISGKLTTNLKSLDISSPIGPSDFKGLHSNLSSNTPGLKGSSFIKEKEGSWTSKGLQSRIDIGKEFSKRGEKESPLKQFYNTKGSDRSDPLSAFTQNKESQRASQNYRDLGSLMSKSPFKKNESPKRDMRSTSEIKPLDYYRKENERTYLESGASPRTVLSRQTDLKGDGSGLLSSRSPLSKENLSSLARTIRERPKSGLLEQAYSTNARTNRVDLLNTGTKLGGESSSLLRTTNLDAKKSSYSGLNEYIKSSASPYSGSHREDEPKPKKVFNMELKSLGIMSGGDKESSGRDSLANFRSELGTKEGEGIKSEVLISEHLPLQRVHEVQDLFYNANEKAFDQLSADYIEELVKLSSVIMQRVKGSSYYNRT